MGSTTQFCNGCGKNIDKTQDGESDVHTDAGVSQAANEEIEKEKLARWYLRQLDGDHETFTRKKLYYGIYNGLLMFL